MKVSSTVAHAAHHAQAKQPPAKAAKELLALNPDLIGEPFGQLVSKLARGELPPIQSAQESMLE